MLDASLIDDLTLILAAVAPGRSVLPRADARLGKALEALGARFDDDPSGIAVHGTGNGCLLAAQSALELDDNPAVAMLVTGLVASYAMPTRIAGTGPAPTVLLAALAAQGVQISQADARGWTVEGPPTAHPVRHDGSDWDDVTVAAIALAALNVPGETSIMGLKRDPSSLAAIFDRFDAGVEASQATDGTYGLRVTGQSLLAPLSGARP